MQAMVNNEVKHLVVILTLIFLMAPVSILIYISIYSKRKRRHLEEKEQMKVTFNEELIKAQHEIQEQTMQTIGADLHDNIGQILSLTALTLKSIEPDQPLKILEKVESAVQLVSRSIQEMRSLGKLLQGDQLISKGLHEAILHEVNWIEKSGKYKLQYVYDMERMPVGESAKDLILFRTLQEILNNIIKHAHAQNILITLRNTDNQLELCVSDDGIGFDAANLRSEKMGMGLRNIQKRASIIGGDAEIISAPNKGASVTLLVPYP